MVCLLTGGFSFLTYAWTDAQQFDELVHEWSLESLSVLLAPRDRNDFALEVIVFIQWVRSKVKTDKQVFLLFPVTTSLASLTMMPTVCRWRPSGNMVLVGVDFLDLW
jgi:hypothetical protein